MNNKNERKHLLAISLSAILLLVIGTTAYYFACVYEFDLRESIDSYGRDINDLNRIRGGLDLKLALLKMAPCPFDTTNISSEEKGNLIRTKVRFSGEFTTQDLTKWLSASPGLKGINLNDDGPTEVPLAPPGVASRANIIIDKKAGKVRINIHFGA